MASLERVSFFRHEGHIFFIYDHTKKTEEDDPKDAILYFYPGFVGVDVQIALVGGIIGLVDFCLEFLPQSMPSIVKLSGRNFALLQHEDFIIGLGASPDTPDACLAAHMQFVWSTFVMYQGSLSALKKRVSTDSFLRELKNVWDYYLPLRQIQEDALSQAFQVLPYVQLHKSQGHLFLHASHILQRSLSHKGVLAGALFNKTRVLCTQLSNSLTRQFLLLMSQSQFPCVEANSVLELPGGVRLLQIYLPRNEYAGLGYRRKKAYVHSKPDTNSKEKATLDSVSRSIHPSLTTPDYVSAQNVFTDGLVNIVGETADTGKSLSFDDGSSGNRSSSGQERSYLKVSPSSRVTSLSDSEVFLDTLSDMIFDSENQLKLADIKQVECVTSGMGVSKSQLCQTSSCSDPTLEQVGSNSSLSLESYTPSLSQDSVSPFPSQNSGSPSPSQDSSSPSPSQDRGSISSRQDSSNPVLTKNSNSSSPIQDSGYPSLIQKNNGSALIQNNNHQDSGSTSPTQDSNNPAVTQKRSNPLAIPHRSNTSPSPDSSNPSQTQDINNHALGQINIHAEQTSGTSKAEENKSHLELDQSFRGLSGSGESPEEDGYHHVKNLAQTPHSCSTDSCRHDTPFGNATKYGMTTNTSSVDSCCADTMINDTHAEDYPREDTHFDDTNKQEMFSEDISSVSEDTSPLDRSNIFTPTDTNSHITSSDVSTSNASSYNTLGTDIRRHENGDNSRQNTSSEDTRKLATSTVDTSSKDTSHAETNTHANSCSESAILQDKVLNIQLHVNKNGNKCDQNEPVMAGNQEHCGGLESSADLKSVTMLTDSMTFGGMFNHSYSDSVDSSEAATASSNFNNSLSTDQQQNKVNSIADGVDMITDCHDKNSVMGTDSGEVKTLSLFQNGRVTSQTVLQVKDSTGSLELESEVKFNKALYPNGEITSELRQSHHVLEGNNSKDSLTSSKIKHKSEQSDPDSIQKAEAGIGIENGLSDSTSMSVSDLTNSDSRFQRSPQSPGLSQQTAFNLTEILAQNKQQIDASLEARLSGDESSANSSSELKHDDHEVSSYSLAYNEASTNKDRLTFEFIDSEFSEGGLMSPASLQLSPVTESSGPTMDDRPIRRSGSEPKSGDSKTTSDHKSEDLGTSFPEWSPERDGLEELTLYAQGHSDTLLVLLVSQTVKWNKLNINSLWKSCLPHLAELDFQVKDAERHAKDESENVGAQHQYLKYDTFSQNLKGSALLPVTSLANEIVDSSIRMHDSFSSMPDLQEITYRSHSACCYGQRMVNTETYFQIGLPRLSAGICPPNDKTFCLDQMAEKILQNDK